MEEMGEKNETDEGLDIAERRGMDEGAPQGTAPNADACGSEKMEFRLWIRSQKRS